MARLGVQGVDRDDGAGQVLIIKGVQQRSELGYLVRLRTDLAQSGSQRVVDAAAVRADRSAQAFAVHGEGHTTRLRRVCLALGDAVGAALFALDGPVRGCRADRSGLECGEPGEAGGGE
ncbi:hypothetical protein OG379_37990 [Streptomyces sp. NBC_01166]|nr:hypothetical protein OG379_37990 [Streptomyces sp. NBC_01166]